MKKSMIILALLALSGIAYAQEKGQAPDDESAPQVQKDQSQVQDDSKYEPLEGAIIGVGSTSQCPGHLFIRGPVAALFEVAVCKITGRFSSGSQCYAVWEVNGKTRARWISARDSAAMDDFYMRTASERRLLFTPKRGWCDDGYPEIPVGGSLSNQ